METRLGFLLLLGFLWGTLSGAEDNHNVTKVTPYIHQNNLAVRFDIAKGWHIYAAKEEAGSPPQFTWPDANEIVWPQKPKEIETPLGPVKGYENTAWAILSKPLKNANTDVSVPICNATQCRLEKHHIVWDFSTPIPTMPSLETDVGNASKSLMLSLFFAFLGGLILNLMPCVLPVLSLKILGLIHARESGKPLGAYGLSYGFGVVTMIMLLGEILLIFRSEGARALGWGFHLQIPGCVAALMVLFFVLALNSWRVFEFPGYGYSQKPGAQQTYTSTFLEGALLTFVAAPCTAPFMSTAIAVALQGTHVGARLIFMGLGFGLALPMMILSFMPQLMAWIPKPGPWMIRLREVFGFAFFATILWLSYVLGTQTSLEQLLAVWVGILGLGIALWMYGNWRHARFLSIFCGGLGLFFISQQLSLSPDDWEPYSETRIQQLEASGTPYFIDFTATWCITCQANKKFVLNTDVIKEVMKGIVRIRADWTSEDPAITRALKGYGRAGVPVYVLYSKGKKVILPEILTQKIVLKALETLNGRRVTVC